MLKNLWYFLTFKSYKNNLLTTQSSFVLFAFAIILLIAALIEGFAWGHLGTAITTDAPYLGQIVLFIIAFLIIWVFDTLIITQDVMNKEHYYKILSAKEYNPSWLKKYGYVFIFAIRIGILLFSLHFTAPALTELAFKSDIQNEIELQFRNNITQAKDETLGKLEKKITEQQNYIQSLHDKLQNEIAGKKGSKYGKGPVAQSIEQEIDSANSELNEFKANFEKDKIKLETAIANNDEQVLKSFGILMVKDSPVFRQNAIDKLKNKPAFKEKKHTIDGFLALAGLILVLSKLLQPRNLKLYYSSILQEAWEYYKKGSYDKYLSEIDQSVNMPDVPIPETFEKIAIRYAKTIDEREKDNLDKKQKQKQAQLNQEMEHQKIKESERVYNERQAKEAQRFSYEDKVTNQKKGRISHALKQTYSYKQKFMQEEYPNKEPLLAKQDELEQALFEAKRLYESKQEDATARQKRLQNEQNKLAELQQLAQEQEQKDNTSLENVKSFIVTQEALEKQKQTIKNMQDNYLTFERDMNSHKEKVDNLTQELNHITEQIEAINDKEKQLNAIISDLELEELKFLSAIAKSNTTAYLKGDDNELAFIAQKKKMNNGVYEFTHFNTPEKVVNDE